MATQRDNELPYWLQVFKQVGADLPTGLETLLDPYTGPTLRTTSDADPVGHGPGPTSPDTDVPGHGAGPMEPTRRVGKDDTTTDTGDDTGWPGPVGGKIGFPGRGGTHYPAKVLPAPVFIRPGDPGNPSDVTWSYPQLPDPNDNYKTHDFTGAPVYWDPTNVTGGTMGRSGTFVPTGGAVHGLGAALGLGNAKAYGGQTPFNSGYDLPEGYAAAIARGPAASVDFLQSGPRGASGLTAAQEHLVNQIVAKHGETGQNQFQEYLDALGASQTPTGTSVSGKKITTPGGVEWMGGAPTGGGRSHMPGPGTPTITRALQAVLPGIRGTSRQMNEYARSKGYVYIGQNPLTQAIRDKNPGMKFITDK